jgi:secreted trypsin-like serine protease
MRRFWRITGLLFAVLLAAGPVSAITWGVPDTEHVNVGAMVVDWPGYGPWQFCTGTLVHPRVFLTAGHCTDAVAEYGIEKVWVNFDPDANNLDSLRLVDQVLTHPDYGWGSNDPTDVGLLILAEPVLDIAPATLPSVGYLDDLKKQGLLRERAVGARFTVVGYGGILSWPPPEITYEDQRLVAQSEYKALTKVWLHMSQNRLQNDGGTCFGDSGGPGFYTTPEGDEILVGITSWGDSQCVATGFDYRVDIPQTLDFIQQTIYDLE